MSPEESNGNEKGRDADSFWEAVPEDEGTDIQLPIESPIGQVDKMRVVEALLFVSPEPISVERIAEVTGFDRGAIREITNELIDVHNEREGGMVIREVAGGYTFYADPSTAPYITRLIKSQVNVRLTKAALETIAIVAYLQPVSRGVIAEIRGVQSEGVIKTLEERGLVHAVGRGGPPGYPTLYGTTNRFLERFGLQGIEELPELESFAPDEATVEKIKRSLSWEISEVGDYAGSTRARKDPEDTGTSGDSFAQGSGEDDSRGQDNTEWSDGNAG